ncbi:RimK family alpha-L-glutamate ligase [Kitasatospora sp. NPDC051170]|uniref:RimK family alpha-L-glutamate ligase n=1 Tax=Kitasatospora sp. NPDC051170 TaxID=3364056 RepID=UPI0037938F26
MRVGLIAVDPGHPVLAATVELLGRRGCEVVWVREAGEAVDVCLLKAHGPQFLALARELEARGVPVVNSAAATELCQDRVLMARRAEEGGLPFASTLFTGRLGGLASPAYPFVVKSRHSRREDLVARVDGAAGLRNLLGRWAEEPVVVQPFLPGTGWDQKLWVVDGRVFAARRRSELWAAGPPAAGPWEAPAERAELALRAGEVFGLDVYGVDLLDGAGEPVIVDVNAFPGIRGQEGAPEALAGLAMRVAESGPGSSGLASPGLASPGSASSGSASSGV